ncbi:carbon-monoxide dehydrogenase medium subunit [Bradyrhizobium sp. AZCC 2262]|uniref:FAD binding domain-containing protein n=1 Tax=Bradyrhizobium sp. AZCC 2262 TaxID=3117022 RepID=UPI002FF0BF42
MPAADERLHVATSLSDALAALADRGHSGAPLAGATWIMRAPLREERQDWSQDRSYVAISKIEELRHVDILDSEISIGSCVTHAELALCLAALPDCRALAQAAARSANPAIRGVATVGGNLCASGFAAADLIPALICLEAEIELAAQNGAERVSMARFLELRTNLGPERIVRRVLVPRRAGRRSAHLRLPLRKAGDYPVAIVSIAAALGREGLVASARVAVGSVEPAARRWRRLEADLIGRPLDSGWAAGQAESYSEDFQGRDAVEAPGWYRVKVLPNLVRRAVDAIREQH